ncbi:hypothetical protein [Roseiterribacter gracilis]|uniref:DUF2268 domain-containing protein n=1 Tax=Roseiterribacter gracilis TaxID=2812848 RepID=A0A8S8XCS2_9PROT|nr:hypothetical protein TMPK1_12430 [Rhodospirillales bacterium TMPK1]
MRNLLLFFLLTISSVATAAEVKIERGTTPGGLMTPAWKKAIRDRHEPAAFKALTKQLHPLQPDEIAWYNFVRAQIDEWRSKIPELDAPFAGVAPPKHLVVLLGNAGGDDGFTSGTDTICFDLADWRKNYGEAGTAANADRVRRILSHEYTHLLVARWSAKHPYARNTPYARAVYVLFNEGLGNYYSLTAQWRAKDGVLPDIAQAALTRNGPVLADRMQRLRTARVEEEAELTQGLSRGPFEQKWGAIPIALWLSREQSRNPDALRRFVAAGPAGVPAFIERNLQKTDP